MSWKEFIEGLPLNAHHITIIINWCGFLSGLVIFIIGAVVIRGITIGWGDKYLKTGKSDNKNDE